VSSPLRETEIRPAELMAEQARRYRADVDWLLSHRDRFVATPCPACGADRARPVWRKDDLDYVLCEACETVYMNPRPEPDLLGEYYRVSRNYQYWNQTIFSASEDVRREKIFAPRAERVARVARRHGVASGTLVDVGAGFGTFCEEVVGLDLWDRIVAVEPEPHLARTCREKGLEVIEERIEDARLGEASVITSFEVIEHLFSPAEFVRRCGELLRPRGLLILTCPNVKGFDIVVLREAASAVSAEHLNYMHLDSLAGLLDSFGFEVLERETPGRLDVELVRNCALEGKFDLSGQPFLKQLLVDDWQRVADAFQDFLVGSCLSSNMWLAASKR